MKILEGTFAEGDRIVVDATDTGEMVYRKEEGGKA